MGDQRVDPHPGPGDERASGPMAQPPRWKTALRRTRWLLARVAALLGVLLVVAVLATAGAGSYTSRPEFC